MSTRIAICDVQHGGFEMDLSTPALLFGSISLLLLAYTNRFAVVAALVRNLHDRVKKREAEDKRLITSQIPVLKRRLYTIKNMQVFGVLSFILCTGSLFSLFLDHQWWGKFLFFISVMSLLVSLIFGLWEVMISKKALDIILNDLNDKKED